MVKRIIIAAFAGFIFMVTGQVHAMSWPQGPNVQAKSWALLDANSGKVLSEHNENEELAPASLTKMMTLYLAFGDIKLGRLKPDEAVSVSRKAWKIGGSTMFLDPRMHPTVKELLHGIATLSGNDACIALAEHIAGSESAFVERMNKKAHELGMTHTHFVNATGFPAKNHYSSAMDMAKLGAALFRDFPKQAKIFSEKSFTYKGHTQPNRNRLLWSFPSADGIKTGHTKEAGYCLVGTARRGDTRLVSAVFGTSSDVQRARQSRVLLAFGFRNFVTLRPDERDIRRQVAVYQGKTDHVWLIPTHPIWVTVPKGYEKQVAFRLRYPSPLIAPVKQGQDVGVIEAVLQDEGKKPVVLAKVSMQARRKVERASWIGRKWDTLRLWWSKKDAEETP